VVAAARGEGFERGGLAGSHHFFRLELPRPPQESPLRFSQAHVRLFEPSRSTIVG
jgi:hypothetical protein